MGTEFTATRGRISLSLQLEMLGRDAQLILRGGRAHIGAVAIAPGDGASPSLVTLPGHREGELALAMAQRLAHASGRTVCVSAGIHYDHITREEINTVLTLVASLTDDCLAFLSRHNAVDN